MEPIGMVARQGCAAAKRGRRSATGCAPSIGIIRTGTKGVSQPAMTGEYPCVMRSIAWSLQACRSSAAPSSEATMPSSALASIRRCSAESAQMRAGSMPGNGQGGGPASSAT